MNSDDRRKLIDQLKRHEGLRLKPYTDTVGKLTIGYGRNLDALGISQLEAEQMLATDLERATRETKLYLPFWSSLDPARQAVLVNMVFNMGIFKVLEFKQTLEAVLRGNYEVAATRMLDSKWAVQVGPRAVELAQMMRSGEWSGIVPVSSSREKSPGHPVRSG